MLLKKSNKKLWQREEASPLIKEGSSKRIYIESSENFDHSIPPSSLDQ